MYTAFYKICGTVVILNILFILIPEGKYEKYIRFVAGLIVILTVAGSIFKIDFSPEILSFDFKGFDEKSEIVNDSLKKQTAEVELERLIFEQTGTSCDVDVEFTEGKFSKITVTNVTNAEKTINIIMRNCDINRNNVVLQ